MKRSPLCGRNFEYFSEDPYLAGELAANYVIGVQNKGVGTSLKHFAANNQEYRRMSISAEIDERTLREIYLPAFETVVRKAQPWTIMCSYNRINGVYSCENDWLLTKVLRDEWGFEGLVMTDWGAMNDRVAALMAGLELEMPSSNGETDREIVKAVREGRLPLKVLDLAVTRILTLAGKYLSNKKPDAVYNKEEHHLMSKRACTESAVLLKNEDQILPLSGQQKVAFIGQFAKAPRYQGSGSSHVNSYKVTNAYDSARDQYQITYAQGYDTVSDLTDEKQLREAVETARAAEAAIIFAGLPDSFESEGYDRSHLSLPDCQNRLIEEVAAIQPNTIIVLHAGAPVTMPWAGSVKGILNVYLGGQAVGEACVDLLFGKACPGGKLAETYPLRLQDNPSYLNFPGTREEVNYKEGIFIGYRHYDALDMDVLFPFGYGLSYTTFEYSQLTIRVNDTATDKGKDTDTITVAVKIKNTGNIAGKEIVQLYISHEEASIKRPKQELKGFDKIYLEPGEEKTAFFTLDKRSFAYYHEGIHDWYAEGGSYEIRIGASSRDIRLTGRLTLESTTVIPFVVKDYTTWGDILRYAKDPSPLMELSGPQGGVPGSGNEAKEDALGEGSSEMIRQMMDGLPLHSILSFDPTKSISIEAIQKTIDLINSKQ